MRRILYTARNLTREAFARAYADWHHSELNAPYEYANLPPTVDKFIQQCDDYEWLFDADGNWVSAQR